MYKLVGHCTSVVHGALFIGRLYFAVRDDTCILYCRGIRNVLVQTPQMHQTQYFRVASGYMHAVFLHPQTVVSYDPTSRYVRLRPQRRLL